MSISVVIVLHDSGDVIEECLRSLPADVEVIVVDNASRDDGSARAVAARSGVRVVRLSENRGFGAGCNHGVRATHGDVVVFLNPDTIVERGTLERLAETVQSNPGCLAGPEIRNAAGEVRHMCRRFSRPLDEAVELMPVLPRVLRRPRRNLPSDDPIYRKGGTVDYVQGCCLAIERTTMERLGGFDEEFFLYSEEEDLAERLAALGGRTIYVPTAWVEHAGGTSTGKQPLFSVYHFYRSKRLLYRKRYGGIRSFVFAALIGATAFVHAGFGSAPESGGYSGSAWYRAVRHGLLLREFKTS